MHANAFSPFTIFCAVMVLLILFIRWGARSIPHAIVFVIVFPMLIVAALVVLTVVTHR